MIPILFSSTATTFTTQGLGALADTIVCYIDEERNGKYEGLLRYPITGAHYNEIALRSIIVAKPNYTDDPQPFRVYEITKPLNGVVTVYFRHISYDLSGYPVEPFTASTLSAALSGLTANCPIACPFTLTTSRSVTATFKADVPASIRSWLGGKAGSLLDVYGGEWSYNKFTATLATNRGANRGVTIRYGKNLTSLEQDENCAAVYTGVYPYWTDTYGENLRQITGRIVYNTETTKYAGATYDYTKILPLDLSSRWEEPPNEGQLKSAAISYIETNEIGTPKVNLKVEFVQISDHIKDRVDLCDTVTIQFEKLGVSATAKCIKTRWNVLLDRYEEITLGDAKTTLADTIVTTKTTAEKAVSKSTLEAAVDSATAQITGNNGGYVVLHDSNGDGQPDELLVMNTPSISTATKVWRFNQNGLGYSSTGYSGTYGLAMTQDGAIVADYITAGTLDATLIKAGILQDAAGINSWNMETGEFNVQAAGTVQSITTYYAESWTNTAPPWEDLSGALYDANGEALYDSDNERLYARRIWTTTVPTSTSSAYRWMRNYIVYRDGTTALTSAAPMQDYYGRANLVLKSGTDSDGNPIGIMSGEADYIRFTSGQLEIRSPQFTLDREGNASFSGNLSAATGSFTGSVTATSLTLESGVSIPYSKISSTPDLTVYVEQGKQYGSAASATTTGFKLTSAGLLTASNAVIYGQIYATSLTLGTNVTVSSSKVSGLSTVATSGSYSDLTSKPDLTVYVEQGKQYGSAASASTTGFKLTSAGLLTASNAVIYGSIYATSLTLGTNVTVSSSKVSGLATVATSGSYSDLTNKPTIPSLNGYIYVDGTVGSTPAAGATGFVVSAAGALQASNAIIYGSLYSSTGTIGGMTLKNNALYNGTSSMSSTTAGVYLGTDGLRIYGSSTKYINATSAGDVTVKGGSITGSTVTGSTIQSEDGTSVLDNDGLTLRNAATDATSTRRLKVALENSQYPTLVFSYRSTTSGSWTTKRPIGWVANQNDVYGFRGSFWDIETESGLACNGVQVIQKGDTGEASVHGTVMTAGRLFLAEHSSAVGTVVSATSSVSSLPNSTTTNLCSVTLTKGVWVVSGQFSMTVTSSESFRLITSLSTTSGDYAYTGAYNNIHVGNQTAVAVSPTRIIEVTATSQTVYLVANQNSGSAKSLTASRNLIRAVCIA